MSQSIAELARLEAEAAEAEDDTPDEDADDELEGDQEDEQEDEPEAVAAVPPTDVLADKAFEKIERAAATYRRAVEKSWEGLDLGLQPCPCCKIPGLVFPYQGDQSDDIITRTMVDEYFGQSKPTLEADPAYVRCDACDGWGKRSTPSRVSGNNEIMCSVCAGTGHREQAQIDAQRAVTAYAQSNGEPPAWTPPPNAPMDEFGRPAGHPHYGIHPSLVGM